jgi:DnaK suppressor protein
VNGSDGKDFGAIRHELLIRQKELEERIAAVKQDLTRALDHDFAEQATELETSEVLQSLGAEAENEIEAIRLALKRIADGHYGVCDACGQSIEPQRLLARPYSIRCFDCATEAEEYARR